jgi:hypothetical protein
LNGSPSLAVGLALDHRLHSLAVDQPCVGLEHGVGDQRFDDGRRRLMKGVAPIGPKRRALALFFRHGLEPGFGRWRVLDSSEYFCKLNLTQNYVRLN